MAADESVAERVARMESGRRQHQREQARAAFEANQEAAQVARDAALQNEAASLEAQRRCVHLFIYLLFGFFFVLVVILWWMHCVRFCR